MIGSNVSAEVFIDEAVEVGLTAVRSCFFIEFGLGFDFRFKLR